jgi:orotate phosphoribosyltransferase-like protein
MPARFCVLVVEVLSEGDAMNSVVEKLREYGRKALRISG